MTNMFLLDSGRNLVLNMVRSILAWIDQVVYSVVAIFYRAVFNIANFDLPHLADEMMERVYVILGIFMLFKVTVSLITYLVDPDKISDKEVGVSKLATRIVVVLVMLIGLPTFFDLMTEAQNKLLPVVPRVITGTTAEFKGSDVDSFSMNMSMTMLKGFAPKKEECAGGNADEAVPLTFGNYLVEGFAEHINDPCIDSGGNEQDMYKYQYLPVVSTAVGVLMIYVLISLSISVAIRAFKLIILRTVAPIPIMSYMDPKSSKTNGTFNTWWKTFLSTWLDLFINVGIIYFITVVINEVLNGSALEGFYSGVGIIDGFFLTVFIIIGLLMFARDMPKFVMDALGIKNSGGFTRMLGMGATAIGGVGSIVSSTKASREKGHNVLSSAFTGAGSGIRSLSSGGHALLSDKDGKITAGIDAQRKFNASNLNNIKSGYGLGKQASFFAKRIGGYDIDYEINNQASIEATAKQARTFANTEGAKVFSDDNHFIATSEEGWTINFSRNDWKSAIAEASARGGPITINKHGRSYTFGGVGGSMEAKISGDLDDHVGNMFIEDYNRDPSLRTISNDKAEIYDGFLTSYANAAGVDKNNAKTYNSTKLKNAEKAASGKKFNLEQERGPKK